MFEGPTDTLNLQDLRLSAVILGSVATVLLIIQLLSRKLKLSRELTRKTAHVSCGRVHPDNYIVSRRKSRFGVLARESTETFCPLEKGAES